MFQNDITISVLDVKVWFPCCSMAEAVKKGDAQSLYIAKGTNTPSYLHFLILILMVLQVPHFLMDLSAHQDKQEHPESLPPADKWPLKSACGSRKVLLNYSAHYYECKC